MAGTVLTEICLGLGPCGELRYPAYQARWPPHTALGLAQAPAWRHLCALFQPD